MTPEELNKRIEDVLECAEMPPISPNAKRTFIEKDIRSLIREVVTEVVGENEVVHQTELEDIRRIKARKTRNFMRTLQRQRLEEMLKV